MPGKSHGPRSLGGYSPWGRKESDTTERLPLSSAQPITEQIIGCLKTVISTRDTEVAKQSPIGKELGKLILRTKECIDDFIPKTEIET